MRLPIGIDNSGELVTSKDLETGEGYAYADKSLFVREVLRDGSKVIVLLRPHRFGRTINISMLQHFLAAEVNGKSTVLLFDNLAIFKEPAYMAAQGKNQVVSISFKGGKQTSFKACMEKAKIVIADCYKDHEALPTVSDLRADERRDFNAIIDRTAHNKTP